MLGCALPREAWRLARADRLPGPRAAPLPRPDRHREPRLPRPASRPRRAAGADRASCSSGSGWSAAPASWCATSRPAWRSGPPCAARCCTSRSCCCSTSRAPISIRRRRRWSSRCSAPAPGRTRVLVTHDVEAGLAEADRVLAPAGRRRGRLRGPPPERPPSGRGDLRRRAGVSEAPPRLARGAFAQSSPRTCGSSCGRCSRCRRWPCSRSPRSCSSATGSTASRSSGSLAAGVLLATRAVRGDPRDQPPVRRRARARAASTRSGWRRSTAARCSRAKAAALVVYLRRAGARSPLPAFARLLPGRLAGLGPLAGVLLLADVGLAATGTLVSSMARQLPRPRPARAAPPAAAAGPADDRGGGRGRAAARRGGPVVRRRRRSGWPCWRSTILTFAAVGYAVYDFLLED